MRFFVCRNLHKRFPGERTSTISKRNKPLSGFTNCCLIPSISVSFLCAIIASKASNTAWKHETKRVDTSAWDNHQVFSDFSNFWTFLLSPCCYSWNVAALILENFMSFHNFRMVLSTSWSSWYFGNRWTNSNTKGWFLQFIYFEWGARCLILPLVPSSRKINNK